MSKRRRGGKLAKLNRPKRPKSALVIARTMPDELAPPGKARYFRGPDDDRTGGPTVVVWRDGRFTLKPAALDNRALARMPDGLAQRVNDALKEGKTNG